MTINDQIRWGVQLAIGAMFTLSVVSKLRDPMGFVRGVQEYRLLPQRTAFTFAWLVILCEGFLSLSHLTGWCLVFAVSIGFIMLGVFFVAISISLARERDLPCFCFGSRGGEMISSRSLARLAMAILGELVLLLQPGFSSGFVVRPAFHAPAEDIVAALSWMVLVLLVAVWALSLPDLWGLALQTFRTPRPSSPSRSVKA